MIGTGLNWLRIGTSGGLLHGDEPSGSLKIAGKFLNGCTIPASQEGLSSVRK
jgi:hypothetical protein